MSDEFVRLQKDYMQLNSYILCKKPFFQLNEFLLSTIASKFSIENKLADISQFRNLCNLLLETLLPARLQLQHPIFVNSGFRCPELNRFVGGVENSFHLSGCAADIHCCDDSRLFEILSSLPHTELLIYPSFIHVALCSNL